MVKLADKQKKLLSELENIRSEMDTILSDESVVSFPKAYKTMTDNFDDVIQRLEDGEFGEEEE
jgi:molecular chaperone GrpE (heat shock protein)